jgi:hypothetical protein
MIDSDGSSPEDFFWSDVDGRYALQQGFSAAVLVRPSVVDVAGLTLQAVWGKGTTVWSAATIAWTIAQNSNAPTPNSWTVEYFDAGMGSHGIASTTVPNVNRTDLLVLRFDRVAGNLQLWINGIRAVNLATTAAVVNNSAWPLRVQRPNDTSTSQNKVGFLGFWKRPLADSEIAALNADPFTMFHRRPPGDLT